ncbi:hypothetical protein [Ornithinimicrobium sufpigmenti]|uniref:hypothetical protein n=1 Tax=Ornithinimicrobium sufpigmenti TaxID=2508882 RepID=UPI0010366635|nr:MULTISPECIES: hypothetical protein [unclassified Ornithinimicrobium]
MPWFKIDDTLAYHHKVMAAGNPAMGLWVRAGSYCAQQLTDGFVSNDVINTLGTRAQALRLVAAGLWESVPGGFRFHDWTDYQPTKSDVQAERAAAKERQARWRATRRRNAVTNRVTSDVTDGSSNAVTNASRGDGAPSRPDPSLSPLTPLSHAASLLGWEEEDERLRHLDTLFTEHNVRARHAWLTRCHETGDLEHLLAEQARAATPDDPWAHLPRITDADLDPPGGDPA